MWATLTSVIGNLITSSIGFGAAKWICVAVVVALLGLGGWGYYERTRANDLEDQVVLYKQQLESSKTLDELNKQIATTNQTALQAAIDRQNEQFDRLAALTAQQSQNVLDQLTKSQASTATQYARVTQAIGQIQITSCENMVAELIKFPRTDGLQWSQQ